MARTLAPGGVPAAYLYYMLYDRSFNFVTSGWKRVTVDAGFNYGSEIVSTHERLFIPQITITDPGYIYIFVSNESEDTKVWFDDLKVTHTRSNIVAGSDFYPLGMAMENREITREEYRYGYQGQYAEKDKETGWNAFEVRNYDPSIGRWLSTDPAGQYASPYVGMGNAPNMGVDSDGQWSWLTAGIGFVAGAGFELLAGHDFQSALTAGISAGVVGGLMFKTKAQGYDKGTIGAKSVFKGIELSPIGVATGNFFGGNFGLYTLTAFREIELEEIRTDNAGSSDYKYEMPVGGGDITLQQAETRLATTQTINPSMQQLTYERVNIAVNEHQLAFREATPEINKANGTITLSIANNVHLGNGKYHLRLLENGQIRIKPLPTFKAEVKFTNLKYREAKRIRKRFFYRGFWTKRRRQK